MDISGDIHVTIMSFCDSKTIPCVTMDDVYNSPNVVNVTMYMHGFYDTRTKKYEGACFGPTGPKLTEAELEAARQRALVRPLAYCMIISFINNLDSKISEEYKSFITKYMSDLGSEYEVKFGESQLPGRKQLKEEYKERYNNLMQRREKYESDTRLKLQEQMQKLGVTINGYDSDGEEYDATVNFTYPEELDMKCITDEWYQQNPDTIIRYVHIYCPVDSRFYEDWNKYKLTAGYERIKNLANVIPQGVTQVFITANGGDGGGCDSQKSSDEVKPQTGGIMNWIYGRFGYGC